MLLGRLDMNGTFLRAYCILLVIPLGLKLRKKCYDFKTQDGLTRNHKSFVFGYFGAYINDGLLLQAKYPMSIYLTDFSSFNFFF